MANELRIEPVESADDRERFIRLPWALYADDPNWVPPLIDERRRHLDPGVNPYFEHADVRLWLALRGARCVGRISAQVDRAHLDRHGDATGQFGMLEAEDDAATFAALLGAAEGWLRDAGMRHARGPFSLSINDECGLLVDGFKSPPSLMMGHARPYYARRLAEQGYAKAKDLLAYDYDLQRAMPPQAAALAARAREDGSVTLRRLRRAHYDDDVAIVLDIFNDAWSENWGFVPLTAAEMAYAARTLKPLVRADLVCIAELDGAPAAMAVALPNLNEAIADLDGAPVPFGWLRMWWRLRVAGVRSARMALMGVRRRHVGTPVSAALGFAMVDRIRASGLRRGIVRGELSWVLEDNRPMRHMIESLGAHHYKTYRIFERALA